MSDSLSWSLGVISLTALSIVLTRNAGSVVPVVAIGGASLAVTGSLWWLWRREQTVRQSPISEYLAVAYGWAYYASLVFTWETAGERWVDWLIILPPISFVPLIVGRLVHMSSRRSVPTDRAGFIMHRLAAAVFVAAAAFLVLSVLAAIVAPVPLIAATFHVVAGRFYARQPST